MLKKSLFACSMFIFTLAGAAEMAIAGPKTEFKVGWTNYIGWAPWQYAEDAGIVKKWADKFGITIDVVETTNYLESIRDFTDGRYDAVTVTNMDAFIGPAKNGVPVTALVVGSYSNGNDMVVAKGAETLADLKGRTVNLVLFTVSHYLLARGLESAGLTEQDIVLKDTPEDKLEPFFDSRPDAVVATWNPYGAEILAKPGAVNLFDSAELPGEILDLLVASEAVVRDNPAFAKAITGIWYETVAVLSADTPEGASARAALGRIMGTDQAGAEAQLLTTHLFRTPLETSKFLLSESFRQQTARIRSFLFDKGLLGIDVPTADAVGIRMPDGSIDGNPRFVKLHFPLPMIDMAAAD